MKLDKLDKKLLILQSVIIIILFTVNIYIFDYIKEVEKETMEARGAGSISLEQASVLAMHQFHDYAQKQINALKHGLDTHSCEVLDYVLKCMEYERFLKYASFMPRAFSFPKFHAFHLDKWEKELASLNEIYGVFRGEIGSEIFYFHHGLRFANKKIQNYVRNRDIIDAGAGGGDSLMVLSKYTDKTIYCYEFSDNDLKCFAETVGNNKICSRYKLIPSALGESVRKICNYKDRVKSRTMLIGSSKEPINMTTIDEEVKKHNMVVGFIKTDVEGYSMPVMKGAIKTIQSQRPVLSLGIYHNHEELFKIKPFLEQRLTGYIYEFHLQTFKKGDFNEMMLLCYPKELAES
ncbi:MAG: FkbM family methyltransferase [Holosporaceae bacterium]|nr:FkbM family methyltransferase [Holosporaceae bacterium]